MSDSLNAPQLTRRDTVCILLLSALSLLFIFYRIGVPQLYDWDEALYASIAAEMVQNGDWAVLHLQAEPWLEKEPLPFWLMGVSYAVFGFTEFAVRFPSALIGSALIGSFYLIARFFAGRAASFALSLIFFFSPPLWETHTTIRSGDLDSMALTFFLSGVAVYLHTRSHKRYWWLAALPLACGIMIRGVMGVVPLVLILCAEYMRTWWKQERWSTRQCILFASISCAPWLLWQLFMLSAFGGEFVSVYWREQFSSRITHALQGHAGDASFYWKYLLSRFGVVFWVIAFSVLWLVYDILLRATYLRALLLAWLALTLIPIHIMETKLYWYILPAVAPLLLCAWLLIVAMRAYLAPPRPRVNTKRVYAYLFAFFLAGVLVVCIEWPYRLARGIHAQQPGELQLFSSQARLQGVHDTTLVVYETDQWNFGRVMPRLYWYGHVVNKWNLISVGPQNLEHYLSRPQEYPLWLTSKSGMRDLEKLVGDEQLEAVLTLEDRVLIKNQNPTF